MSKAGYYRDPRVPGVVVHKTSGNGMPKFLFPGGDWVKPRTAKKICAIRGLMLPRAVIPIEGPVLPGSRVCIPLRGFCVPLQGFESVGMGMHPERLPLIDAEGKRYLVGGYWHNLPDYGHPSLEEVEIFEDIASAVAAYPSMAPWWREDAEIFPDPPPTRLLRIFAGL